MCTPCWQPFPKLTCILCDIGLWGADRYFRPLIEAYPNIHVEISQYWLDGGIEDFVAKYGPRRLVFGTGLPLLDYGGMMLSLKHAEIDEAHRQLIAAGNMETMLGQVKL